MNVRTFECLEVSPTFKVQPSKVSFKPSNLRDNVFIDTSQKYRENQESTDLITARSTLRDQTDVRTLSCVTHFVSKAQRQAESVLMLIRIVSTCNILGRS